MSEHKYNAPSQEPLAYFLPADVSCLWFSSRAGPVYHGNTNCHDKTFFGYYSFPYTTNDPTVPYGVPLVQVQLDGNVSATFLIDTGTNPSFISDALAEKLALKPTKFEPQGKPYLVYGKPAQSVTIPRLDISGLHLVNPTLLIMDNKILSSFPQHPVDGIIGSDILRTFTLLFDFPHHHIVASYPGGLTSNDIANSSFKDAPAIPLDFSPANGLFSAKVEMRDGISTSTVSLALDTGAGFTSIPVSAVRQLKLVSVQEYTTFSFSGNVKMNKAFVSSFRLGTAVYQNQQVTFASQEATKFPSSLGMDFFNTRIVLIDFPQKKMYIITP